MEELKPKKLFIGAIFFVLGVIVTVAITKYSDKLFPNDPVIVKEVSDTIRVFHEYKLPENITAGQQPENTQTIVHNRQNVKKTLQQDLTYFENLKNENKVVDSVIAELKQEIAKQNQVLFKDTYNEIIEKSKIFPVFNGYMASGQTSNFEFTCPTDKTSDYIDLKLKFSDKLLVDKIACIYLTINGTTTINGKKGLTYIYEQTYKIRQGINLIRIRNYFKQPNVEMQIGYFLKSELQNKYPRFEKISCSS